MDIPYDYDTDHPRRRGRIAAGPAHARRPARSLPGPIDRHEARVRAWVFVDRDGALAEAERRTAEIAAAASSAGRCTAFRSASRTSLTCSTGRPPRARDCGHKASPARMPRWSSGCGNAGAVLLGKTVTTQYASFDPPPTRNPWNLESHAGRLQQRLGGGPGLRHVPGRARLADRRLDHPAGVVLRRRRLQADLRPGQRRRRRAAGARRWIIRGRWRAASATWRSCSRPSPAPTRAIRVHCADRPVPRLTRICINAQGESARPRLGRLRGLFERLAEPPTAGHDGATSAERFRQAGARYLDGSPCRPLSPRWFTASHRDGGGGGRVSRAALRKHPEDYEPNIRGLLEEGLACPAPEYARCKEHQRQLTREMMACFEGVDVLLSRRRPARPRTPATTGDPAFNSPWSYTGLPTVCLPGGRVRGWLPLAIQLVGAALAGGGVARRGGVVRGGAGR